MNGISCAIVRTYSMATTKKKLPVRLCASYAWLILYSLLFENAAALAQGSAGAPDPTLKQLERPGTDLPPPFPPAHESLPGIETIPGVSIPRDSRLSAAPKVFVRRFELVGNTVFSADELSQQVTAAYENREITSEELHEVRQKLTLYYVDRGYVNSGAIIPDQQVRDGVIHLRIVEGRLSGIEIAGTRALDSEYLSAQLLLGAGPPLNVKALQEKMMLLQQAPMIGSINAELGPGPQLGEAVLRARIEEESPFSCVLGFANNRSPSVGAERGEVYLERRTLFGRGDPLAFRFGSTSGLKDYAISYAFPVNPQGTSVGFRAERNDADVIEAPFNILDIESRTRTFAMTMAHPLHKTPYREFSLGLAVEHRRSETFLLGQPFSFSPGVQDGKSSVSALRFSLEWFNRGAVDAIAAKSTLSVGLDAFGATINTTNAPDSRFVSWLGQLQWAFKPAEAEGYLVFRSDAQFTNKEVLPLEKFPVGGATSVRGYRENQLVRDNGLVTSLEYRIPLFKLPEPGLSRDEHDGQIELAPFADLGWSWNKGERRERLSSIGLGVRWTASKRLSAQLYWGHALDKIASQGNDLQDDGIHFAIRYQLF